MERNEDILKELQELGSPLANMPWHAPYAIPAGYFEELAEDLHRCSVQDFPHGYQFLFEVPADYFSQLPGQLTSVALSANAPSKSKIIFFQPNSIRMGRIAAAAVLVLGLGLGSYQYFHHRKPEAIAARQLSRLDKDAIHAYVEQHVDEFDMESLENIVVSARAEPHTSISDLQPSEIQEYLQETGEIVPASDNETL